MTVQHALLHFNSLITQKCAKVSNLCLVGCVFIVNTATRYYRGIQKAAATAVWKAVMDVPYNLQRVVE